MRRVASFPQCEIQTAAPVYRQIRDNLERMIRSGQLASASRLPSARELAERWNVSYVAVHKALALMTREGLLERCAKRGTFVKGNRHSVVGILCGPEFEDEAAHFYRRLIGRIQNELECCGAVAPSLQGGVWESRIYDGLTQGTDTSRSARRLHEDLVNHSFGAWIAVDVDMGKLGLDDRSAKLPTARLVRAPDVALDFAHFAYASADYLYGKGCRRLVFVSKTGTRRGKVIGAGFADAARKWQNEIPQTLEIPCHCSEVGARLEKTAYDAMLGWIDEWSKMGRMPDAIIADDDIAMRGLALALVKRDIQIPEKMLALTLANEGGIPHYGIPVVAYEMPLSAIAATAVDLLWKRIEGAPDGSLPTLVKGAIT